MSRFRIGSSGFTIVEFMIATSVFSVILLTVMAAILHMSRMYQSSLYQSSTQAAASNLVDTVSQALKFSSTQIITANDGAGADATYTICVGNRQFLYVLGRQIAGDNVQTTTQHAVVTRLHTNCPIDAITASTPAGSPKELLGKNMRLANLDISQQGTLYRVTVRVVYGDDDLLCSPSIASSCDETAPNLSAVDLKTRRDLKCKLGAGSEYCAVTELSNTVYRRL